VSQPKSWTIVKLRPDGSEAARYPALGIDAPPGWIAASAVWGYARVDIGLFAFEPEDVLLEYFSLDRHFNAFATYRSGGELVGWYCNVTYPTTVSGDQIRWHDLYVDVVMLPDGRVHVLDEDELAASGLAASAPDLHTAILNARDEIVTRYRAGAYPFSETRRDPSS
jgi:hypothetical protein